jgi:hypothetical protein
MVVEGTLDLIHSWQTRESLRRLIDLHESIVPAPGDVTH